MHLNINFVSSNRQYDRMIPVEPPYVVRRFLTLQSSPKGGYKAQILVQNYIYNMLSVHKYIGYMSFYCHQSDAAMITSKRSRYNHFDALALLYVCFTSSYPEYWKNRTCLKRAGFVRGVWGGWTMNQRPIIYYDIHPS